MKDFGEKRMLSDSGGNAAIGEVFPFSFAVRRCRLEMTGYAYGFRARALALRLLDRLRGSPTNALRLRDDDPRHTIAA
jgi:hypothetical protein